MGEYAISDKQFRDLLKRVFKRRGHAALIDRHLRLNQNQIDFTVSMAMFVVRYQELSAMVIRDSVNNFSDFMNIGKIAFEDFDALRAITVTLPDPVNNAKVSSQEVYFLIVGETELRAATKAVLSTREADLYDVFQ